jgi:hypothetical protein
MGLNGTAHLWHTRLGIGMRILLNRFEVIRETRRRQIGRIIGRPPGSISNPLPIMSLSGRFSQSLGLPFLFRLEPVDGRPKPGTQRSLYLLLRSHAV